MRRKEREVKNPDEILEVLSSSRIVRLGFNDNGSIYIVPLNFGFEYTQGKLVLYFHGARDGRKYGLIEKGGSVGFEMDCNYKLGTGKEACDYTAFYSSIIGEGIISEVKDTEEKKKGLNLVMLNATGKGDWNYPSIMLSRVGVFKVEIKEFTCKAHRLPEL